jgi:hypothetical protein
VQGSADSDVFRSITRKGEFAVVIGPRESHLRESGDVSDADIADAFRSIDTASTASGKREAAGEVARRFGLTTNQVYRAIERTKL